MQTAISASHAACLGTPTVSRWLLAGLLGILVLGSGQLQAQTVYRIVGPDGQVTFSDMPGGASASKVSPVDNIAAAPAPVAAPIGAGLPFELRQVVGKYPVTLYTSNSCAPCDSGRRLLLGRGVPFSEKTINTAQDAEAFQKLTGNNSLPVLSIGAQQMSGFSASEWTEYLTAAGYPERSRLPASYRGPQAAPLVVPEKPATPASAPEPEAPALPPVIDNKVGPDNPTGIQF